MKKRITALLLCMCLLVTSLSMLSAEAAETSSSNVPLNSAGVKDGTTVTVTVTAADGETQNEYILKFNYLKNNDATLKAINILYKDGKSELLPNFDSDSVEYNLEWTTQEAFITEADLQIVLSDEKAEYKVSVDPSNNTTIYIEVTAQDGTIRTYTIKQAKKLSNDNKKSGNSIL